MSDVLVDTSAWVEFFRDSRSKCGAVVDLLLAEERVCTTPLVIAEIVSGARSRSEFERLQRNFFALPQVDFPQNSWLDMLESRWSLKQRRITDVSISNLIIAHVALIHKKAVLTRDNSFRRMRDVLGLNLVEF